MPRAAGNDLCELFGYAPDDTSSEARKQWKSQECPFVGGVCIKHNHPQEDKNIVVYGSCSVSNKTRGGLEEVILCPQRLYANNYESLKFCLCDAVGKELPIYTAAQYSKAKKANKVPDELYLVIGRDSGREISLSNPGVIKLSLDWVLVHVIKGKAATIIPCEVQSIDTTGNYHANWRAYAEEKTKIPDSMHGMNWANVWKRLIPQLILKGSIAATSVLCTSGIYFIVPDRVYMQFEKIIGVLPAAKESGRGVLTIVTYGLGPDSKIPGKIRQLERRRVIRVQSTEFAKAFAEGKQLPLGSQLDYKVMELLAVL